MFFFNDTATTEIYTLSLHDALPISGFEKKIAQQIREQAAQKGLSDQFDEILVPSEEVTEVRRGQKINSERKFFPGYVLVKMAMSDEAWHLVKDTPKVTGFLGARNKPSPITEA